MLLTIYTTSIQLIHQQRGMSMDTHYVTPQCSCACGFVDKIWFFFSSTDTYVKKCGKSEKKPDMVKGQLSRVMYSAVLPPNLT